MKNNKRSDLFLYQLINTMSSAMSASDIYTAHHQNNVSIIARLIGQEMNLSSFEVEGVRVAGQLHDIGKFAIPNELLSKYGDLIAEEISLIKTHVVKADELISDINFPWPVREMVLQHHERMNGSGYPSGLKGDEICLGARIIAVSDTADAMINARPYRRELGIENFISEITNNSYLYDEDVCKSFMAIVSDGGLRIKEMTAHPTRCYVR